MNTSPSLDPQDIHLWHREVCAVTDWLLISGDLPPSDEAAADKLDEWLAAGVTDIVDVRGEHSDERLVARLAPDLRYHYFGTHDMGGDQDASWFAVGLDALHAAQTHENAVLMVHCHMGVNRGPSMALAMLLDQGWDVVDALNAIRQARPIAGIIYYESAIRAVGDFQNRPEVEIELDVQRAHQWFEDHEIDIRQIIRLIRRAE